MTSCSVTPRPARPLAKANITRRLHKALADAGLDDDHVFHDLRHTFGTSMAARRRADAHTAGVDGAQASDHDAAVCRLCAVSREAEMVAGAFVRRDDRGPIGAHSEGI